MRLFGYEFCPEPTFIDEFEGEKLSKTNWKISSNSSYPGSASLFSPTNVRVENGFLILNLEYIGTTDDKGNLYLATSGEVQSKLEFGYGRYEFRIITRGLDAVRENLELLWDGGDFYKHHEIIGLDFQQKGYFSILSTGVLDSENSNAFHSTEVDSTMQPVLLNLKPRFFTIEYTPDSIIWYYDIEKAVRKEVAEVKKLPTHKMRVVFRNWLVDELKYNIMPKDLPIEFQIDYFKFTPLNMDENSCKPIKSIEESESNNSLSLQLAELKTYIDALPKGKNYLVGFSEEITNLKVFENVKVVWIYSDDQWKGYSPNSKILKALVIYKIPIFNSIPKYTGFWIQK